MAAVTDDFAKKCQVKQNDTLGRFVVAVDNIRAGETLLVEEPIVILPHVGERRCVRCLNVATTFCSKCQLLPLCEECPDHEERDCQRLVDLKLTVEQVQQLQDNSRKEIQSTIKCLLLREHPETRSLYEEMYQMDAQLDARRGSESWINYQDNIATPLQSSGLLGKLWEGSDLEQDVDLVQRLMGVLDINAFEIRAPESGSSMRGLYRRAGLFPHSCLPNLVTAIDDVTNGRRMKIYASRFIAAGEILYSCYTNILIGTQERRQILKQGKCFHCTCSRCMDPTELGTHMSSFMCNNCSSTGGYVVLNPETGRWQCLLNPEHILQKEFVANMLERAKEEVFHARDNIYRLELLLAKLSRLLHGNHYIMLDLKQNIASILRQILQNMAHRPNRKVYERKIHLCQEILLVLKVVAPGINRLKAIALYELANTQAELARKLYSEQEQTSIDLLAKLQQTEIMMRESLRMLLFEPLATPEGQLSRNMMRELKELQNDIKMLQEGDDDVVVR